MISKLGRQNHMLAQADIFAEANQLPLRPLLQAHLPDSTWKGPKSSSIRVFRRVDDASLRFGMVRSELLRTDTKVPKKKQWPARLCAASRKRFHTPRGELVDFSCFSWFCGSPFSNTRFDPQEQNVAWDHVRPPGSSSCTVGPAEPQLVLHAKQMSMAQKRLPKTTHWAWQKGEWRTTLVPKGPVAKCRRSN